MSNATGPLEERIARLEEQVDDLGRTVARLEGALKSARISLPKERQERQAPAARGEASEELLSWVDKSYILPRVATTSFILVLAIALRTATDSGTIDAEIGSLLGMLYGFALIVYSWFAYRESNMHAPVFALWGTLIMSAVVVEAHRVFASVPAEGAYLVLAVMGGVAAIISRVNHVALPVFAGTLGMSFGAFAIDYPNPHFPYLTIIMILANAFAAYATRLLRASWLRWLLFVLTLFMVLIWDQKLSIYLGKLRPENLDITIKGFFPAIALLGVGYSVIALLGVLGKIQERISKYDIVLPVINVCWLALAGRYAIKHGLAEPVTFGLMGAAGSLAYLAIAWWLAHRQEEGGLGTTSFALGGGLFLAFTAPMAFGDAVIAYALIALLALGIAWLSQKRKNIGLRLVSYLLQIYACGALVMVLRATEVTKPSFVGALASGFLAAVGFVHYFWARRNPPAPGETVGHKLNRNDRGAGFLLVAALFSGFFTLRVGLFQGLDVLQMATPVAFAGAQSVLINVTAAILLFIGYRKRNAELRNVAIVVTVIGACKVFLVDMVNLKGLPLVVSVFSFGLVAALGSFVLGRWHKVSTRENASD